MSASKSSSSFSEWSDAEEIFLQNSPRNKNQEKRVKFDDRVQIIIVERIAHLNDVSWLRMACDRMRFEKRIKDIEVAISWILSEKHRSKIREIIGLSNSSHVMQLKSMFQVETRLNVGLKNSHRRRDEQHAYLHRVQASSVIERHKTLNFGGGGGGGGGARAKDKLRRGGGRDGRQRGCDWR